ncbi:MAG: hypothetical protein U1E31_02100 [Rickettsiales bacterium]
MRFLLLLTILEVFDKASTDCFCIVTGNASTTDCTCIVTGNASTTDCICIVTGNFG